MNFEKFCVWLVIWLFKVNTTTRTKLMNVMTTLLKVICLRITYINLTPHLFYLASLIQSKVSGILAQFPEVILGKRCYTQLMTWAAEIGRIYPSSANTSPHSKHQTLIELSLYFQINIIHQLFSIHFFYHLSMHYLCQAFIVSF